MYPQVPVPLIERRDGTRWSVQSSPEVVGWSWLNGVSCASRTACMAVGYSGNHAKLLVEHWDGMSWSAQPTPRLPGATDFGLGGVSCVSSTACTAVGGYKDRAHIHVTLVERWNGKRWSVQPSPNPVSRFSTLSSVSCVSTVKCIAVGYHGRRMAFPLVERWSDRPGSTSATR
jgi:hypothetical protein